jgi:UrcA family protein
MRSLIPVLAAAVLAGSAAPAFAEAAPSVVVSYSDLNLATPEGRQQLETRIAMAVNTVCDRPNRASVQQGQAFAECRELAAADAWSQASQVIAAAEADDTVQVASAD